MVLKAYFNLLSQPSRAVVILLRAAKIPHEEAVISLSQRQQLSPEYAKINPFNKIPAIEDDGFTLSESGAILRYVSDEYLPDSQRHWYPSDLKLRAKVNEYLDWHHLNTRKNFAGYVRTKLLQPIMMRRAPDAEAVQELISGIDKTIQDIDSYFLQDRPFLAGDKISIADLQAACEIMTVQAAGLNPVKDYPRVAQWMKRVEAETNPVYDEANKQVRRMLMMLRIFAKFVSFFSFRK